MSWYVVYVVYVVAFWAIPGIIITLKLRELLIYLISQHFIVNMNIKVLHCNTFMNLKVSMRNLTDIRSQVSVVLPVM